MELVGGGHLNFHHQQRLSYKQTTESMIRISNKTPISFVIANKEVQRIKINNDIVWEKTSEPDYFYLENTYNGNNTVTVKQTSSGSPDSSTYAQHLQYSKDKNNWVTVNLPGTYSISLATGEKVYFRGNEGVFNYWYSGGTQKAITTISASQNHTVGGNINTLLDYTDPYGLTLPQGAFNSMFENDTHLTSASDITLSPSSDGSIPTYCYLYMFKGCSALTSAPQSISATTQGQDACNGMFQNCTALTSAPALSATTLAPSCYWSMFQGCTALTSAPALPVTTLAQSCYRSMFQNCTALTSAPALPATTLETSCYYNMFNGCSSLTTAPNLPATTLAASCYQSMFYGATSLVNVPAELPAINLAEACYRNMFRDCTSLTASPAIKAKTFATNSCYTMFSGCSSLNSMTVYANDKSATDCTKSWLTNVASSGTFTNYGSATYTTNNASGIPSGWSQVKPAIPSKDEYFFLENTSGSSNIINLKTTAGYAGTEPTGEFATSIEYSKDKKTWTSVTLNYQYTSSSSSTITNLTLSLAAGEKVYFRNTSGYFGYVNDIEMATNNWGKHRHSFSSDNNIKAGGNPKSLLDYRDMNGTTLKKGCFYGLFYGADELTNATGLYLGETSLAESCYMMMFENCYSLTSIPTLPATTMASRCYYEMFKNTAITSAPTLPATNLAPYCYKNMFESCTSITSAPNLPATTLATGCYQGMFNTCTYLTTAPNLPATTLAEYCYRYMFMGCVRLNSVTTYANDNSANESTRWWLNNVAATGIVHNLGSATYTHNSTDGIPSGWTELNS